MMCQNLFTRLSERIFLYRLNLLIHIEDALYQNSKKDRKNLYPFNQIDVKKSIL